MKSTLFYLVFCTALTACGNVVQTDKAMEDLQEKVENLEKKNEELIEEIQAPVPTPNIPKTSNIEMKIKCNEYGEENYKFMDLEDGYSDFTYFYSPVLDTCVGEREDFGPDSMIKFGLFDMLAPEGQRWINDHSYTSWCEGSDCLTMDEYRKKKDRLMGK